MFVNHKRDGCPITNTILKPLKKIILNTNSVRNKNMKKAQDDIDKEVQTLKAKREEKFLKYKEQVRKTCYCATNLISFFFLKVRW